MTLWNNISDADLLTHLGKDDHAAFAAIYHRYKGILFMHAFKVLKDEEEANDLVQELFTTLWLRRDEISIISNLSGYLYQSIRNKCLDQIAHKAVKDRYVESLATFLENGVCITDEQMREKELSELIEKEISCLPVKMREVFELSRFKEYSYNEIAEELNISDKTVKKQVHNALQILRKKLDVSFLSIFF